ncbi:DUF1353 domain-containing protein [Pseudoalteromonas sp. MMG024]|uniref:DUF1353 domain-containing protein n=1 Tax=Pseudoalteromonas sp. MMG024 TaxID=2909980 RepID=UPI001F2EE15D|nr:DUF1353 domain-containing protein [Pseudoalteromonas sp. MMG024]MCF6459037.1 DUF1353 domain-containing protein [Pseudoalteromonas sp. MMG024]
MSNIKRVVDGFFCADGHFHLTKELKTKFGVVPLPFGSDGFTIPWYLRWFHNPFGIGLVAAIWHDYALKKKLKKPHVQFLELLLDHAETIEKAWSRRLFIIKSYIMFLFVVVYGLFRKLIN